ncbi:MAG: hypothetical protein DMG40_19675 [Acidobacteria bacterium]|nr:MAG: hypothetical protein DMG40_19675 [Acidobacteriota bacterium]
MRPHARRISLLYAERKALNLDYTPGWSLSELFSKLEPLTKSSAATKMTESVGACCTSPAAICYWFAASLIAWGILGVAGIYWHALHWYAASTILFAAGFGCMANWLKNRSFHCVMSGPLFLIAAILFLLGSLGIAHVNVSLVWALLFVGICVAFCLEWRYAKRSASQAS